MATEILELFGTLDWAKVFEHNRDQASWNVETDGECKVTITLDEDNADKLKSAGCQKKMESVEGGTKVTLSRPFKGNNDWGSGTPTVVNVKGLDWDFDVDGFIGNGSTGMIRVAVYDTSTGRRGTRLEAVQVIDHVTYESEGGSSSPSFKDLSSKVEDTKAAPVNKASKKKATVSEDTIPF